MPTTHFVSRTFLKENGLENGLPWDLSSAKKANIAAPVAMVDGGLLQTELIDTEGFMADSAVANNGTSTSLIHDASAVEDGLTSLQLVLEPVNEHENVDRMDVCNNAGGTYAESVAASIFQSSNSVNTQDGDKVTQSKGEKRPTKTFEERIEDLRSYKEKHGHLNVTTKEDSNLNRFCRDVRKKKATNVSKLTDDQIASLDAIGFNWLPMRVQRTFEERVEDLRSYKEKHGHFNVTRKEDSGLYQFCSRMRKRHNNLDASKIASLDALGFDWLQGK
ncbi:hypothetical protein ACHAXR_001045, partial [Thalassiosira sp. AJA248-18]